MGRNGVSYLEAYPQNRRVALTSFSRAAEAERRLVAVHEASHIVAALLVGAQPRVRLSTRRTAGGRAAFSAVVTTRSSGRDKGFIAAAGVVGECKYARRELPEPSEASFQTDFANMGPDPDAAMKNARQVLDDPQVWSAVLRLADI
jgi:hypothetical protein